MTAVFQFSYSYNLRQGLLFQIWPKIFINSISIHSNLLLEKLAGEIKNPVSIADFKPRLSKWRCKECQYDISKTNLGWC